MLNVNNQSIGVNYNGVKTDAGLQFRRPSWNFEAKPVVEVA